MLRYVQIKKYENRGERNMRRDLRNNIVRVLAELKEIEKEFPHLFEDVANAQVLASEYEFAVVYVMEENGPMDINMIYSSGVETTSFCGNSSSHDWGDWQAKFRELKMDDVAFGFGASDLSEEIESLITEVLYV